jgi:anti-sigma B factor antagonist
VEGDIMDLRVIKADGQVTHVALSGKLDVEGEQLIGDRFRGLIESSGTDFLVDMSEVSYLASLGIKLLFAGAKELAAGGKKMVVLDPQPMVEETLQTSGTVKFIPIAHGEENAMGMLGPA